jgi:hypothetical protein
MVVDTKQCRVCLKYAVEVSFRGNSLICQDCNKLPGEKYCITCLVSKPLTEFYPRRDRGNDWRHSSCIVCANKRVNELARLFRYGISQEEYDKRVKEQESRCKICDREYFPLCVDHLKGTKFVRDLLCDECNMALGLFHENIEVLREAIKYLEFWKDKSANLGYDVTPALDLPGPSARS